MGQVLHPGRYKWSSYKATAGLVKRALFLEVDWILGQFGQRRGEAQREYQHFVQAGMKESSPWDELKAQCILGGREFIEKLKPALRGKSKLKEIPKAQRLVYRPSLEKLMSPEKLKSKKERNEAVRKAHLDYGYTCSEIARHMGLHYSTIGRIIKGKAL